MLHIVVIVFCFESPQVSVIVLCCQLFTEPFTNWKNAKATFDRHQSKSLIHRTAKERFFGFQSIISKKAESINLQLDSVAW